MSDDSEPHRLSINYGWVLSARENQINDSKKDLTVKDRAESMLEAYASLYNEIVQGYEDGTRADYAGDTIDSKLTKEEELERLNEAFKKHTESFEDLFQQEKKIKKHWRKVFEAQFGEVKALGRNSSWRKLKKKGKIQNSFQIT